MAGGVICARFANYVTLCNSFSYVTQIKYYYYCTVVQISERQSRRLICTDRQPIAASKFTLQYPTTLSRVQSIEKSGDLVTERRQATFMRQVTRDCVHRACMLAIQLHTFLTITLHVVQVFIAHAIVL